jgi:hypothetical protein
VRVSTGKLSARLIVCSSHTHSLLLVLQLKVARCGAKAALINFALQVSRSGARAVADTLALLLILLWLWSL